MITDRKTAAERQYETFLSAIREFECSGNEGQFARTLSWLVAARWDARRTDMQPESSNCEHHVYRNSPSLSDPMEHERDGVPNALRTLDYTEPNGTL
jgi:hypothetical protein